jgi:hypothetical protein
MSRQGVLQIRNQNIDSTERGTLCTQAQQQNPLHSFCEPAITATTACSRPSTGENRPSSVAQAPSISAAPDAAFKQRANTSPSALRRLRPHPPAPRRCDATPRPTTTADCCSQAPLAPKTPPPPPPPPLFQRTGDPSTPPARCDTDFGGSAAAPTVRPPPAETELCGVQDHIGAVLALVAQVPPLAAPAFAHLVPGLAAPRPAADRPTHAGR